MMPIMPASPCSAMWQWKTLFPAKSRNGIRISTRSPGHEVDRVAPARIGRRHAVPAPDLERPGVQVEHVVLGIDVGDLPELEIAQARLDRRQLPLAVRGQERHGHPEAAADRDILRIEPLDRREPRRPGMRRAAPPCGRTLNKRLGPRRLALGAAVVGLVQQLDRAVAIEGEQQVQALGRRQQDLRQRVAAPRADGRHGRSPAAARRRPAPAAACGRCRR